MENKYTSGLIEICFMALGIEKATILLDNRFDTFVLLDSATGAKVELEISDAHLSNLHLVGMDENDTERLI